MAPRPGGMAAEASVPRPASATPIPHTLTHSAEIPISATEKVLLPLISSLFVRKLDLQGAQSTCSALIFSTTHGLHFP